MAKDHRSSKRTARETSATRPTAGPSAPLVIVKENQLAHAAVERLVRGGTESGDPLWLVYLYGPAGVGKSHFARHFVREARRLAPRSGCRHTTASEFVADLSAAFHREGQAEFQAEYSGLDLLVLEDLAAIQGKHAAQRMLVVILDELKRAESRVIVTCSTLPGQLKDVLPRLANRLRGGLCVPLELFDETSRLNFARHQAANRQFALSRPAAELLARDGPATPREILAALANLEFGSRHNGRNSDARLVEAHLKAAREGGTEDRSLPRIAKAVAAAFGVPLSELRSAARPKRSVLPRHVAMLLARELSGRPAAAIARYFGRKNHTTVVHACRRTRALLAADAALARDVERIRRAIHKS